MVQLKGELCYLGGNHVKGLKKVDFTHSFNLKKSKIGLNRYVFRSK